MDVGSAPGRRPPGGACVRHKFQDKRVGHRVGRARDEPARGAEVRGHSVKKETIAIHGGYEVDPTTKSVAVPIYQTVAYAFDSADHGAALFNLEVEGFRYSRISNPTNAVLERRGAAPPGGLGGLWAGAGAGGPDYV